MTKGFKKCTSCEKFFDAESFGMSADRGENEGKIICDECFSQDGEEPIANVVYCKDEEREDCTVGENTIQTENDESVRPELWEYARSIIWKSDGGYRGFYEGKTPEGWKKMIDSWFCGFDGHNIEGVLAKFQKSFDSDKKTPDFDMIVSFPRTSNCFSTGIEVFVPEVNKKDFYKWIKATEEEVNKNE